MKLNLKTSSMVLWCMSLGHVVAKIALWWIFLTNCPWTVFKPKCIVDDHVIIIWLGSLCCVRIFFQIAVIWEYNVCWKPAVNQQAGQPVSINRMSMLETARRHPLREIMPVHPGSWVLLLFGENKGLIWSIIRLPLSLPERESITV